MAGSRMNMLVASSVFGLAILSVALVARRAMAEPTYYRCNPAAEAKACKIGCTWIDRQFPLQNACEYGYALTFQGCMPYSSPTTCTETDYPPPCINKVCSKRWAYVGQAGDCSAPNACSNGEEIEQFGRCVPACSWSPL